MYFSLSSVHVFCEEEQDCVLTSLLFFLVVPYPVVMWYFWEEGPIWILKAQSSVQKISQQLALCFS